MTTRLSKTNLGRGQKILQWWVLFCVLIFLVGIILSVTVNNAFVIMGLVGFGLAFFGGLIINIFILVKMFKQANAYNAALEEHPEQAADAEAAAINTINNTRHNQELVGTYQLAAYLRAVKNTPKNNKKGVLGILFLVVFLGCIVGFIVFLNLHQVAWALGCWGVGVGSILICLIVHLIHKKIATSRKYIDHNQPTAPATVISCVFSDQSSFGTGSHYHTQTTRILRTTYLVYLDVGGVQKRAYSRKPYNKGDTVYVYQHRKLRDMVVIAEK